MSMNKTISMIQLLIIIITIIFSWFIKPTNELKFINLKDEKPPWFFVINQNLPATESIAYIKKLSNFTIDNNKIADIDKKIIIYDQNMYFNTIKQLNKNNILVWTGKESVNLYSFTFENFTAGTLVSIYVGPPHAYGVRYKVVDKSIEPIDWFKVTGLRTTLYSKIKWIFMSLSVWLLLTIGSFFVIVKSSAK